MYFNSIHTLQKCEESFYLLVNPGSSSENVRKPLLISLVLGANNFDVAVCNLGDCAGVSTRPINLAVTESGLVLSMIGVDFSGDFSWMMIGIAGDGSTLLPAFGLLLLLLLLLSTTATEAGGVMLSTLTVADCNWQAE